MKEVSLLRLYLLRAMYVFMAAGIAFAFWPHVLSHTNEYAKANGAEVCLLASIGAFAALGVRYPLRMLPILLFEFFWKTLWLISMFYPIWAAGEVDAATEENLFAIGLGVVLCPIVIPWRYVLSNYVLEPGDGWRTRS